MNMIQTQNQGHNRNLSQNQQNNVHMPLVAGQNINN